MVPQAVSSSRVTEPPFAENAEPALRLHNPTTRIIPSPEPAMMPQPGGGIRPFAYLKYRWVTVVFLGGLLGSVLAFAAWKVIPSKYSTYSLVRVFSSEQVLHNKEDAQGRNDFAIYLKSQAAMIKSNFVLTAALRDPNVAALPMLREQPDPVRFLEEELRVEYQDGSEILKILLSGDDPRAISQVVNAIQAAYFKEVVDEELHRKQGRLKLLEDSITRMQDEVKRRHDQIKQADAAVPMAEAIPGLNAHLAANQLIRLKESLGKLEADIAAYQTQKAALEKKLANVADEVAPPPPGYLDSFDNDARIAGVKKRIEGYQAKIETLVRLSNDPNLASVVDLRKKIADAGEERERFRKERLDEHQKSQLPVIEKRLKGDLEQCAAGFSQLAVQKTKLEASIEEYQKTISQTSAIGELPTDFPKIEVRERTKIITEMLDKANLLRLEINAPRRVVDFQRASVPLKKDMKKQIMGTVLAGLMGFGLVGLGVVLFESRVRRALSLSDVQKTVLGPMAGVWPARVVGADRAIGEAVEKTRAHLHQQFGQPGGKVIAVTSALTEEGKGYVAYQLAVSFARAGSRTLLVDFDLRSPGLHRFVNTQNDKGLCEVFSGQATLNDVLVAQPTGVTLVPAGHWSDSVRPALKPETVAAFLDALRQQCDVVVLSTHPLLNVAESFTICRAADGIVLSVERQESRLPLAARAHEKLATVGSEAFGIVYLGATAEECLN